MVRVFWYSWKIEHRTLDLENFFEGYFVNNFNIQRTMFNTQRLAYKYFSIDVAISISFCVTPPASCVLNLICTLLYTPDHSA